MLIDENNKKTEPVKPMANEEKSLDDDFIGKKIGDKYTVLRLLAPGGLFKTYLVLDKKCNKQWWMKAYSKNDIYTPELRNTILQGPLMMLKLRHPAIPVVVDIVEGDNSICIIGEYTEGQTLKAILDENGPVAEETVIGWARQLCDVLGYLHRQNPPYIYLDMKPANVVLQPGGTVKLINVGTLKVYDALCERNGYEVFRTKGYSPPEQYVGKTDPRSDIYSLGMTLHHLVTGVNPDMPPYETAPIRAINPKLSRSLEAIILRCIQLDPNERFQSCNEMMKALQGGPIYPQKKKGFLDKLFGGKNSKNRP